MPKQENQEAKEQLSFIKSIMDDSQKVVADNGDGFILWGVLIILAGISSFFLNQFQLDQFQGWTSDHPRNHLQPAMESSVR